MGKISAPEKIILALAAAFVLLTVGYFLVTQGGGTSYSVAAQTVRTEAAGGNTAPAVRGAININTASVAQLQTLPGIGLVRAQDIVSDRRENGPFRVPEDILRVPGIGQGTLNGILQYITVN